MSRNLIPRALVFSSTFLAATFSHAATPQNTPPYCRVFRLDQVIEASSIREELIEKALTAKTWDSKKGRVRKSRSATSDQNKFVFEFLSQNRSLKDLLATCTPALRLSAVEKVRVTELQKLDLPERIKALGPPTSKVPMDAMIFVEKAR